MFKRQSHACIQYERLNRYRNDFLFNKKKLLENNFFLWMPYSINMSNTRTIPYFKFGIVMFKKSIIKKKNGIYE